MTFVKKTPAPTGSIGAEVVVGAAAAELKKAATVILSATESITGLSDVADALILKIDNKTQELKQLEQKFLEEERQGKINLKASLSENANVLVTEHLASQNKIAIAREELDALRNDLAKLKADFDTNLRAQVAAAVGQANGAHKHEMDLATARNAQANAELGFEVKGLNAQVAALKEQNALLLDQLNAERAAGIKRAEASAVGAVNINSGGGK